MFVAVLKKYRQWPIRVPVFWTAGSQTHPDMACFELDHNQTNDLTYNNC